MNQAFIFIQTPSLSVLAAGYLVVVLPSYRISHAQFARFAPCLEWLDSNFSF